MNKYKLSIIVPTYNREDILCDTLDSILENIENSCVANNSEVIVVDQTKKHTKAVTSYLKKILDNPKVKYVYEEIANLPNARNVGLHIASGDIICFLDDDIKLHPGFFNQLMMRYDDERNMAVVGLPILKNQDGDNILLDSQGGLKKTIRSLITKAICISKASVITPFGIQLSNRENSKAMRADAGRGCCMSFRKSVFDKIGYFDSNYIGNALREETDFFYRMKLHNFRVFFDPKIVLDHIMANVGGCRNQKKESYWQTFFDNQFYFYKKNYGFPKWYIKLLLIFDILSLRKGGYNVDKIIKNSCIRAKSLLKDNRQ